MPYPRKRNNGKSVSGDRGAYFLSRRAHLLTTDKVGGVTAYGRRALYEVILITWLKEPTDFYSCK